MKCIKALTWLYILTIIAVITFIACSKGNIRYVFDVSKPDYSSQLSADSIKTLFNSGITVKTYKGHDYFIHNAYEHIDSIGDNEVIDFGPITFEDKSDIANYKFERVDSLDRSECLLELPLISKFEGELKKVELEPAWLKFSLYNGLYNVNLLPSITIKFEDGLRKGDLFLVEIQWTMNHVDYRMPLLVSIRLYCYITDDEYFSEVINLNLRNHNK